MVEQLVRLRDDYDYEVLAIVPGNQGGLIDRLADNNIPYRVVPMNFGGFRSLLQLPKVITQLESILRDESIDIVQSHLFNSMVICRIAAWLAEVPARFSMIASPYHLQAHTTRWIDRTTVWMDTCVIPSCEKTRQLYLELGVPVDRLQLVYYGADEKLFSIACAPNTKIREEYGWPDDTILITKVAYFYPKLPRGRWTPDHLGGAAIKGHEYLVRATKLVLAEFPSVKVLLVGKGWGEAGEAYKTEIEALVDELELSDSVIFTGNRNDVHEILMQSDIAVQCSLEENLGGTIEALMLGRPVVATQVGGMIDSVIDGKTGLLAAPSDSHSLAEAIKKMLRDLKLREAFGVAGREFALANLSLTRTASSLDNLYRRNVKPRHRKNWLRNYHRKIVASLLVIYIGARLIVIDVYLPIQAKTLHVKVKNFAIYAKAISLLPFTVFNKINKK